MKQLYDVVVEKTVTEKYTGILANSMEEAENIAEDFSNTGEPGEIVDTETVTIQAFPSEDDIESTG
jgi:hypothetical protein